MKAVLFLIEQTCSIWGHILRGERVAVVVETGHHTEMGHLLSLLTEDKKEITPLQKQVTSISKAFMKFALISGVLFLLLDY